MEEKNEFSVFLNPAIKSTNIEQFKGLFCTCILENGFMYKGIVTSINKYSIIVLDRKRGMMKFNIEKIVCIVETPRSRYEREDALFYQPTEDIKEETVEDSQKKAERIMDAICEGKKVF